MTSLLTYNHYLDMTNNFVQEVGNSNSAHYFYAARPQPWSNTSGGNDDTAVQVPNNSISQVELDVYDDLIFGKMITSSDIGRVVPKYEWTANTVYSQYDQNDSALYSKNFYVVTTGVGDEYNVYKCIDNNGNTASIIKPSLQTTSGTFKTADGYTWKYMYTIDVQSNTRFTTTGFIPVISNSAVQSGAVPGTIDVIRIVTAGNGYSVYESGTLETIIDPFTIKLPANSSSQDNYYKNSSIYLRSGFGAGQVREVSSYNGTTKIINITDPVDIYTRLDFANSDFITGGSVGDIVRQVTDTISFTVKNGFINEGSTVVQSDTGAAGSVLTANNTTVRVARLSSTQSFANGYIIRDVASTGTLTTDKINISNSTSLSYGLVVTSGTGYNANATVTIVSATGADAVANAQANSTGKIVAINVANSGTGYTTEPTITVSDPLKQSFDANNDVTDGTGEGSNNVVTLATAASFVQGDQIKYSVAPGNTVISGLSNNNTYFIQFANATVIALSNSANTSAGNRIPLTKGLSQTGHFFQGVTATARILPTGLVATNAAAGAVFANDYSVGSFIRVGENANSNIRVVQSVNSTAIVVDRLFANTILSANAFKVSIGSVVDSVSVSEANGVISNTNLSSVKLAISNLSISGSSFTLGERVATTANTSNGTGTVVFSNSTVLYLSGTTGTLSSGLQIRGSSSNLFATIVTALSSPNITLKNPNGSFTLGQSVFFNTPAGANAGYAGLIGIVDLSRLNVDYEIGPTVKIIGDGNGAIAVATVNSQIGMANSIQSITVLNPGSNYTEANVTVYANTLYGTGATARAVVSPINGHGYYPEAELGSRYACLDMNFNTLANENWYYPSTVSFRKFGILKDPVFSNAIFQTTGYTSVSLVISNTSSTWSNGELVTQATTNAAGFVVSGNNTVLRLRDTIGSFANGYTIYGYTSDTTANTISVQTTSFILGDTIVQPSTGGTAKVISVVGSNVNVRDIRGKFVSNAIIQSVNTGVKATLSAVYRSDDGLDVSTFFTKKFNQTGRLTLGSNTGAFSQYEYVSQSSSGASGRVISTQTDLDLSVSVTNGSFAVGDSITNSNTSANAKVVFANSTYLKLTAVSNTNLFVVNNTVQSTIGASATISNAYPVLVLTDVSRAARFTVGTNPIVGANSGATAPLTVVINPDLVKEPGTALYVETSNTVINRDINTAERVRVVIKF